MKSCTTKFKANAGKLAFAAAGALLLLGAFSSPLRAEDGDNSDAAPQVPAGHHYEITDEPNTPPVNFRSEEDERYNTPAQHDAEMYAEEYERKRKEKQMEEQRMLQDMNTLTSPDGTLGGNLGARDAGFPPRAPY